MVVSVVGCELTIHLYYQGGYVSHYPSTKELVSHVRILGEATFFRSGGRYRRWFWAANEHDTLQGDLHDAAI